MSPVSFVFFPHLFAIWNLLDTERFMPHGHCFLWEPGILWTSVISDALIGAAYIAIPFTLVFQIMRKRKDLPFNWMFVCFGMFIVACGMTHMMDIVTVWLPLYSLSVMVKALTAAASVPTAIILFRIAPKIVQLPSVEEMVTEQTRRTRAEAASEAKDRFIAVLSHELRTPLTPVKAGLDLIEDELRALGGPASQASVETIRMIRNNLAIETKLINDLLDLSASGQGKLRVELESIDLRLVVEEAVARFRDELAQKNIHLDLDSEAPNAWIVADRVRVSQIVNNLLSNAVKFTPVHGAIELRLAFAGDFTALRVRDTGCGIEPGALDRVFQPFEQTARGARRGFGGLGLGLSIARILTELQHGRLVAESSGAGRGATFTLELPRAQMPPATESINSSLTTTTALAFSPRVLLVDDHSDTLQVLAAVLRKAGYRVQTAQSIQQAEELLGEAEILVTDIGLPDGSGCDLMARFKSRHGRPGIAISGFGQEDDLERSRNAGFQKHLVKPIDVDLLRAAVREVAEAVQAGR